MALLISFLLLQVFPLGYRDPFLTIELQKKSTSIDKKFTDILIIVDPLLNFLILDSKYDKT